MYRNDSNTPTARRTWLGTALTAALILSAPVAGASTRVVLKDLPWELQSALVAPVREKLTKLGEVKNEQGIANKRGAYSRLLTKIDEDTYQVAFYENTAGPSTMTTERKLLTLKRDPAKKDRWTIAADELQDTYDGLHRSLGVQCAPFQKFTFDESGLTMSATNGGVCSYYYEGEVAGFIVVGDGMQYQYTAPKTQLDYYAVQKSLEDDYAKELAPKANAFEFECDPTSCRELLSSSFTGLELPSGAPPTEETAAISKVRSDLGAWVDRRIKKVEKDRRENPFIHFRRPYDPVRRAWNAVVRQDDETALGLNYDNWDGFELTLWIEFVDPEDGHQLHALFGYYTEETMAVAPPYELEQRDDFNDRWYDLSKVHGDLEVALQDPEIISGSVDYGINIREDLKELPFVVATLPQENEKKPSLSINSVEYKGKDLTWVQTSPYSGLIVFPETLPAGSNIDLRIVFSSRALTKVNHAYTETPRASWIPLMRFGDFIEDFELTLRVDSKYKTLGVGKKVSEQKDGNVTVTRWKADNPVEFPSFIFGKYQEASAEAVQAKKLDGTIIPVTVHVDEVSMGQVAIDATDQQKFEQMKEEVGAGARGIRTKQLRPIAEQAAAAINLYTELSGVDYPYGELNLVNDPAPALYGQAPSSLIYLGSMVFRGEGTMSGDSMGASLGGGGGTGVSKFLKSVVAHEVGHQWWGSRVANSNQRNYWFVESLAEYFSAIYLERVYGVKEYQEQVDEWRRVVLNRDMRSSVQNASALFSGSDGFGSYQAAVYNKGPYAFHILRETFGDEKFFDFLKKFSQELTAKGEIVTRDIQIAAETALGGIGEDGQPYKMDLEWFFDQWIRGVGIPQYRFLYEVRQTEEGKYIVEGKIQQRIVMGSQRSYDVIDGKYYRGLVPIYVKTQDGKEYKLPVVIEGAETAFRLPPIPTKPVTVALNKDGEILSMPVVTNQNW